MLRNLDIDFNYNTSKNDMVKDFYLPIFSNSIKYKRGVGYFTSGWLKENAQGLAQFVENGGTIQFITSPILDKNDLEALQGNYNQDIIDKSIINNIKEIEKNLEEDTRNLLGWLVYDGILEFKFAIPKNQLEGGEFHDKFGIFIDEYGDYIAFNGSMNDSIKGFRNYESISVFKSWGDETSTFMAEDLLNRFEQLWQKKDKNLRIYSLDDIVKQKLIKLKAYSERPYEQNKKPHGLVKEPTKEENKWIHQDKAVAKFMKVERGLLNMATGTGKTITSIKILKKLLDEKKIDTVIIATYGNSLLKQWYKEILPLRKEIDFRIYRHYEKNHERQKFVNQPKHSILLTSYDNLDFTLKNLSPEEASRTLIIYDEVHRLGANSYRKNLKGLSDPVRFRLGLSATPERAYDEEGNAFIESHIGPTFFTFDLKNAIEKNILAPFNYFPLSYRLTEEEKEKIQKIRGLETARRKEGKPISKEDIWRMISDVYKLAENKVEVFNSFIKDHQAFLERSIIFVHNTMYAEEVLEVIHKYRSDFHTYFSGDDDEILKKFAKSKLESLVACHRLSEGIDIRSLNNVILFSSDRARLETIQRIGRCLRTDTTNPQKIANVVDFICEDYSADREREEWLEELSKIKPKEN